MIVCKLGGQTPSISKRAAQTPSISKHAANLDRSKETAKGQPCIPKTERPYHMSLEVEAAGLEVEAAEKGQHGEVWHLLKTATLHIEKINNT